jgi:phosphatidylglycerophosphate synthase
MMSQSAVAQETCATSPVHYPPLRPLCEALRRLGVTPNAVTLFSFAAGMIASLLVAAYPAAVGWAILLLLVSFLADLIDGDLARISRLESRVGDFLDCVCDRAVDAALIIAIGWQLAERFYLTPLALAAAFLVSFVVTQSRINFGYEIKSGLFSRAGRSAVLTLALAWHALGTGVVWPAADGVPAWTAADAALAVIAVGGTLTFIGRLIKILRHAAAIEAKAEQGEPPAAGG